MKNVILTGWLVTTLLPVSVFGSPPEELRFGQVWNRIRDHSPALQAAREEVEAGRLASFRAGLHWVPTVGVEARAYNTDDSGNILFSKLAARSISGTDFSPLSMNFPTPQNFARVTLGLDWKLFEGGVKRATAQAADLWLDSARSRQEVQYQKVCGEAVRLYSGLLLVREEERELDAVDRILQRTLDRYRIGSRANPLGHSGLLGLESLENRIQGELASMSARRKSYLAALDEMGRLGYSWLPPAELDSEAFALSVFKPPRNDSVSVSVTATERGAQAHHRAADAERSRFLPQIGVFTDGNFTQSTSSSAFSYSAGGYLRWELFNPSHWVAVREARARANSSEAQAQALAQAERVANARWLAFHQALSDQIRLAEDSLKLMGEQSRISLQLFQSGALNALQLSDVLGRRVELVIARAQMGAEKMGIQAEMLGALAQGEVEAVCN